MDHQFMIGILSDIAPLDSPNLDTFEGGRGLPLGRIAERAIEKYKPKGDLEYQAQELALKGVYYPETFTREDLFALRRLIYQMYLDEGFSPEELKRSFAEI